MLPVPIGKAPSKSKIASTNKSKKSFSPIPVPTIPTISGPASNKSSKSDGTLKTTDTTLLISTGSSSLPRANTRKPSTVEIEQFMRLNEDTITPLRNRFAVGRREKFYFLTVPGLLRLVECFFALLHVTMFGYYGTFYEKEISFVVTPFYIATSRELLFLLTNYFSFMSSMVMVISGIFSSTSNTALISSLYPFIFDLVSFIMMAAAAVSNILLFKDVEVKKKMVIGLQAKGAASYTGAFLATLHFVSCVYDLVVFIRRWERNDELPAID